MKKVIISLVLIITLCTNVEYKVYADAGSLVVSGGAIAVGGLSGAALAGLTGPVVVAVFLGLMAFGMNVELTKQSQAAGMTKTEFVKNKIQDYCDEVGISIGVFNQYILEESQVLNDGRIQLSNTATSWIKKFGNWLMETDQVSEGTNTEEGSYKSGDVDMIKVERGRLYSIGINSQNLQRYIKASSFPGDVYLVFCKDSDTYMDLYALSQNSIVYPNYFNYYITNGTTNNSGNGASRSVHSVANNWWYYGYVDRSYIGGVNEIPVFDGSISVLCRALGQDIVAGGEPAEDSFTGSKDDWAAGNNVLDQSPDQSTVINPGLTGSIPIPADKDIEISVPDYLDALEKALDKVGNPALDPAIDIPAVDDSTGLPTSITIPNDVAADPTIDKVPDNTIDPDQKTPILDNNSPPTDPDLAMDPLKFDLRNIFPFCLPWDIKDMLNLLSADPVAPRYRVQWHIPIVNTDLDFTVDLSTFNDVAAICRKMELLAFIIGLAVVTRKLIRS